VGHHWSLSLGHRAAEHRAAASLLGIDFRQI
jgi:L-arabinose isomerase